MPSAVRSLDLAGTRLIAFLGAILADLRGTSGLPLSSHPPLPMAFDLKRPTEEIKEGDTLARTPSAVPRCMRTGSTRLRSMQGKSSPNNSWLRWRAQALSPTWCGRWTEAEVRTKAPEDLGFADKLNGYTTATSILAVIRLENSSRRCTRS